MTDVPDSVASFVDALLKNRRPPRFRITPPDAEFLPIAAMLRAAAPGADAPDPQFVERLRARLQHDLGCRPERGVTRRRLLSGFGIPTAAALVGAAGGVVLRETVEGLRGAPSALELIPSDRGAWTLSCPSIHLRLVSQCCSRWGKCAGFSSDSLTLKWMQFQRCAPTWAACSQLTPKIADWIARVMGLCSRLTAHP